MRRAKTVAKVPFLAPDVETKIIPSPTDGWDQISPLAEMDPKRAPILTNWVPRPGYVEARQGYFAWNKPSTSPVESLMVYRPPSGETMFAAAGNSIYDVSNYGTSTAVQTGLGSARWQYVGNFTPSGAATVLRSKNTSKNTVRIRLLERGRGERGPGSGERLAHVGIRFSLDSSLFVSSSFSERF